MEKEVATLVRHSEPSSPPCLRGRRRCGNWGCGVGGVELERAECDVEGSLDVWVVPHRYVPREPPPVYGPYPPFLL